MSTAESRLQTAYDNAVRLVMSARDERDDVLDALEFCARLHCAEEPSGLVMATLPADKTALRVLERYGRFKIERETVETLCGRWGKS